MNWGDCYRVIATLKPELKECVNDYGFNFSVPFDPHNVDYYKYDSRFRKLYSSARSNLPKGVRVCKIKGKYFFQTEENFICGEN